MPFDGYCASADGRRVTMLRRCIGRSWRRWSSHELQWGTSCQVFWEHLMLWNPHESLIAYTIMTHRARRRIYEAFTREPPWSHVTFIRLRSVEESSSRAVPATGEPSGLLNGAVSMHIDTARKIKRAGVIRLWDQ